MKIKIWREFKLANLWQGEKIRLKLHLIEQKTLQFITAAEIFWQEYFLFCVILNNNSVYHILIKSSVDSGKLQVFWITQKRKSFREKEERKYFFFTISQKQMVVGRKYH